MYTLGTALIMLASKIQTCLSQMHTGTLPTLCDRILMREAGPRDA